MREPLLLLGRSNVDDATMDGANPENIISDAHVAQDLAYIHPNDLSTLDAAHVLGHFDLRGWFRYR